ncbi:glycosyltransferase family 2 protein [Butyrivibrio sp. AE3004]|uniref:glycosyltransferase family 2 protein n=1 Tax=Butyrivibrio sp. AE3004 TaxID=1506994 RepID=UPI0004946A4F|nr:glycosyltransferase [Butyrivibrio sp. AE3004]
MNTIMGKPMVSVIIPAYRAQDYIEDCVKSVCAQKISDYVKDMAADCSDIMEIVIVDDGSTDSTGEICDRLSDNIQYLRVFHVKNGGVSKARNIGIENSCGRYIAFVDADDLVGDHYISDLLESALRNASSIVIMDGKISSAEPVTGHRYIEDGILSEDTHVWGKLFLRELLDDGKKIRFPEGLTIGEDMLFLLDALIKVCDRKCISLIEGDGYKYNYNDSGAMLTQFKPSYLDQIKCWDIAEERISKMKHGISSEANVRFAVIKTMAALLVVSKFAKSYYMSENRDGALSGAMKDKVVLFAKDEIKRAMGVAGAYGRLSFGYKIKVAIFSCSPGLYIKLYGQWKKR